MLVYHRALYSTASAGEAGPFPSAPAIPAGESQNRFPHASPPSPPRDPLFWVPRSEARQARPSPERTGHSRADCSVSCAFHPTLQSTLLPEATLRSTSCRMSIRPRSSSGCPRSTSRAYQTSRSPPESAEPAPTPPLTRADAGGRECTPVPSTEAERDTSDGGTDPFSFQSPSMFLVADSALGQLQIVCQSLILHC